MKKTEHNIEIVEMLSKLGWSEPAMEYAGNGNKFKSTKTPYKFRYTNSEGVSCFRAALSDSIYDFLKWQFRADYCSCFNGVSGGIVLRSNYGSSVKCTCNECGGYYTPNPKLKESIK